MDQHDAELLAAVCDGSERAFNLLVDRHQQAVRQFLRRVVGPDDADDVAQETFLALWSRAHSFQGGAALRTWLLGIAWRKAKDLQRTWFRRRQRDTAWLADADTVDAHSGETRLALEQALVRLSLEQRAAVMLCLAYGLSHSEAAQTLGMPLGTVKSHVARGRDRLREVLGDKA